MKLECMKLLSEYPQTYEEDMELLEKDQEGKGPEPLSENHRNAVLMRSGEKKILKFLMETADLMLPMLDMTLQDVKKHLKTVELTED